MWGLWGNIAVFVLLIPAGYVLAGHAAWVRALLFVSGRLGSLVLWLERRSPQRV